ncbi:MAG TPA: DUF5668 domain-containing protein [Bryobacteraceae bacterium]|jgi:hypothetical protein|nr:DUF5668 domain-containing protein [Bryobacteraceae bacterium]
MSFETQPRGTIFALALIVAGALLFLDNLGIVPIEDIGAYWPLAFVVYGLGTLYYKRGPISLIWSGSLIVAGVLLILGNLGILHVTVGALWPLLLIALGATLLVDRSAWGSNVTSMFTRDWPSREQHLKWKADGWKRKQERWAERIAWRTGTYSGSAFASNLTDSIHEKIRQTPWAEGRIREIAVFFGTKRRVESQDFQGGELVAVFGSIELDLTAASMQPQPAADSQGLPTRRAVLEGSAVFGSVEITVPRNWRIIREGTGIFASYEDKTIPRPEPGVDPPTLVIRGGAVFGSVEIRN